MAGSVGMKGLLMLGVVGQEMLMVAATSVGRNILPVSVRSKCLAEMLVLAEPVFELEG